MLASGYGFAVGAVGAGTIGVRGVLTQSIDLIGASFL